MDTKLTLKLDKLVIENAKKYASENNRSLSKIIESYLKSLVNRSNDKGSNESDIEISPFVKSLSTGVSIPPDYDYRDDLIQRIEEKHK